MFNHEFVTKQFDEAVCAYQSALNLFRNEQTNKEALNLTRAYKEYWQALEDEAYYENVVKLGIHPNPELIRNRALQANVTSTITAENFDRISRRAWDSFNWLWPVYPVSLYHSG